MVRQSSHIPPRGGAIGLHWVGELPQEGLRNRRNDLQLHQGLETIGQAPVLDNLSVFESGNFDHIDVHDLTRWSMTDEWPLVRAVGAKLAPNLVAVINHLD